MDVERKIIMNYEEIKSQEKKVKDFIANEAMFKEKFLELVNKEIDSVTKKLDQHIVFNPFKDLAEEVKLKKDISVLKRNIFYYINELEVLSNNRDLKLSFLDENKTMFDSLTGYFESNGFNPNSLRNLSIGFYDRYFPIKLCGLSEKQNTVDHSNFREALVYLNRNVRRIAVVEESWFMSKNNIYAYVEPELSKAFLDMKKIDNGKVYSLFLMLNQEELTTRAKNSKPFSLYSDIFPYLTTFTLHFKIWEAIYEKLKKDMKVLDESLQTNKKKLFSCHSYLDFIAKNMLKED